MQDVARTIPACRCGKDSRLKQAWVAGRVDALLFAQDCFQEDCDFGSQCWQVFEDRPFETTAWREDLVACGCGAEGRLKQAYGLAYDGYQRMSDIKPSWLASRSSFTIPPSPSGLYCLGCNKYAWPVVPGVPVEFPGDPVPADAGFVDTNLAWFMKVAQAAGSAEASGLRIVNERVLRAWLAEINWPERHLLPQEHRAIPVVRRRLFIEEEED